jgi:prepilin-type N-terminal cleavage/methylation domain-containing protein
VLTRIARGIRLRTAIGSNDDDGFTLIELLVVIFVFGILSAMVLSLTISSLRTGRQAQAHVVGTSQAQQASERMSRDLRVADPLLSADANDVSAKVYRNGACEVHRWYLGAASQLLEDILRYPASSSCSTATGTASVVGTVTLVNKVLNSAANPVFTFARWNDTLNPPALVSMTAPVSSNNVPLVDRVTVLIDVYQPENRKPVVVQSAVDLRNVVHTS